MNLEAELAAHLALREIKTLVERGILTPLEAIDVCRELELEEAPLGALQRARLVDYLRALSDVWIRPKTAAD